MKFPGWRRHTGWLRGFCVLALAGSIGAAELPRTRCWSIFPAGGRAGTTSEVEVAGLDLDDARALHFSDTNIAARVIAAPADELDLTRARFSVAIGRAVRPGYYEARVEGRFGVSNPRWFAVGNLPERVLSAPTHDAPERPLALEMPGVVNARMQANRAHYYLISARKGARTLIQCVTDGIDSKMVPILVATRGGTELERCRSGGLLDFTAPQEGTYRVMVHDLLFRGGPEFAYRLIAGASNHIDFVFPPAVNPGGLSPLTVYGRNLTGGKISTARIGNQPLEEAVGQISAPGTGDPAAAAVDFPAPAQAALRLLAGEIGPAAKTGRGRSTRSYPENFWISSALAPLITEQEANQGSNEAQRVETPFELAGRFFPAGDRDAVIFHACKDEILNLTVYSQRLGCPTDAFAVLQHMVTNKNNEIEFRDVQEFSDSGPNIGGPEIKTSSLDPEGRIRIPEAGAYRLWLTDLANGRADPRRLYRMAVTHERPGCDLIVAPLAAPSPNKEAREARVSTLVLRRGETVPLRVLALRRGNYSGAIELGVDDLPPGVTCDPAFVSSNLNSGTLLFRAAEGALRASGPIRVRGRIIDGSTEEWVAAKPAVVAWEVTDYNNEAVRARLTADLWLSVIDYDPPPFSLAPSSNRWDSWAGGNLDLALEISRQAEFSGPIKLKLMGAPFTETKEITIPALGTNGVVSLNLRELKAAPERYALHFQAQGQGKHRRYNAADLKSAGERLRAAENATKEADRLIAALKTQLDQLRAATSNQPNQTAATTNQIVPSTTSPTDRIAPARRPARENPAAPTGTAANTNRTNPAVELSARLQEAEKQKEKSAALAKGLNDAIEPKEITYTAYAGTVILQIRAAPIEITAADTNYQAVAGGTVTVPLKVRRLFGFNGAIELESIIPKEAKGISAAKLTLPPEKTEAELVIQISTDTAPGRHHFPLEARVSVNNHPAKVSQAIELTVSPKTL